MKLDDGRLSLVRPSPYAGWAIANAGFVCEDDQQAFSLGLFLRLGQVRRFQERTASSLRSIARFSGYLRAEAERAQDAPDLRLAKANAVHAFDDSPHTFERPEFGAKSLFSGALQEGCTNSRQLLLWPRP